MEQYVVKVLVPHGNQYVTFRQFEVTGWRNANPNQKHVDRPRVSDFYRQAVTSQCNVNSVVI